MALSVAPLNEWHREGAKVDEIVDALTMLRHGEQRTATRTSVVNLVVVASTEAEAERAEQATMRLAGRHPGRTLVLICDRSDTGGIDADVSLHEAVAADQRVWWEEVRLRIRGGVVDHLNTIVEPLAIPDLPVAVWFVGRPIGARDPLLDAADAVLVDTKEAGGPAAFGFVGDLASRAIVVDLSWVRLRPWRQLMAGLFEGRPYRPFIAAVHRATVTGKAGPRQLLAGWLASRLGLSRNHFHQEESRHASMALFALHEGREATFTVERDEGARLVRASARVAGGPGHEDVLMLPDESLPWSLAEALTNLAPDEIYRDALRTASAF